MADRADPPGPDGPRRCRSGLAFRRARQCRGQIVDCPSARSAGGNEARSALGGGPAGEAQGAGLDAEVEA